MQTYNFKSVLFLCVANAARSQMAEGLARSLFGKHVTVQSAGSRPKELSPHAVQALAEIDIDISSHHSKSVTTIATDQVDLIVTLCAEEECPVTHSRATRLHWPLPDPAAGELDQEQRALAFRDVRNQLAARLDLLKALQDVPAGPQGQEFHASIRTPNLPASARFYTWLLGEAPKEWTHRYATFVSEKLRLNFVLLVDEGKTLHQDTLYHLGLDVGTREAVVRAQHSAHNAGWPLHKPARTTWRGTPLHELWLRDPGGNLVEIYARVNEHELAGMPDDKEPTFLVQEDN